ncbi:hypothetical protein H1S01_09250 [Heliobacterium chlorum]|uniref:Uncharacterized protein n=1 Tax=Heliobacterium chlorum TaxID=2698 RepID=A0ABR7T208_HELCL|nr:hypothetical protein [Heliobacterium chlorum]MBC9784696.1 hypothetical protein [Heliobacterium chlorum]
MTTKKTFVDETVVAEPGDAPSQELDTPVCQANEADDTNPLMSAQEEFQARLSDFRDCYEQLYRGVQGEEELLRNAIVEWSYRIDKEKSSPLSRYWNQLVQSEGLDSEPNKWNQSPLFMLQRLGETWLALIQAWGVRRDSIENPTPFSIDLLDKYSFLGTAEPNQPVYVLRYAWLFGERIIEKGELSRKNQSF